MFPVKEKLTMVVDCSAHLFIVTFLNKSEYIASRQLLYLCSSTEHFFLNTHRLQEACGFPGNAQAYCTNSIRQETINRVCAAADLAQDK